jgi:malonate decarboxylase gamma subunit
VKSQAYGRREGTAAIFLAAAAAADAYATARMKGHPVISLVVGQAISGGFLTHGYQANRILAFDDPGVVIHAMHKEAAARITLRTVEELNRLGHEILPLSYDIQDYAKLGLLHKLLHVENPDTPSQPTVAQVQKELIAAIADARSGSTDLSNRIESEGAREWRRAGIAARARMQEEWALA